LNHWALCLLIIMFVMICEKYWSTLSKYIWMYAVQKWGVEKLHTWKWLKRSLLLKQYVYNDGQQFHQYQQNEWLHLTSNHRTCRKTVCYLCFNSFFPPFKICKVFIRAHSDGNTILAMQAVNIFSNKYSCWLFAQILITLLKHSIILLKNKTTRL
jgi:hypothetical protein